MTERFIIRLTGPQACGKTILRRHLIDMLLTGPKNHHPVTIYDGTDGEEVWDIDNRMARRRWKARRDYNDAEWALIHVGNEPAAKIAWEARKK